MSLFCPAVCCQSRLSRFTCFSFLFHTCSHLCSLPLSSSLPCVSLSLLSLSLALSVSILSSDFIFYFLLLFFFPQSSFLLLLSLFTLSIFNFLPYFPSFLLFTQSISDVSILVLIPVIPSLPPVGIKLPSLAHLTSFFLFFLSLPHLRKAHLSFLPLQYSLPSSSFSSQDKNLPSSVPHLPSASHTLSFLFPLTPPSHFFPIGFNPFLPVSPLHSL